MMNVCNYCERGSQCNARGEQVTVTVTVEETMLEDQGCWRQQRLGVAAADCAQVNRGRLLGSIVMRVVEE